MKWWWVPTSMMILAAIYGSYWFATRPLPFDSTRWRADPAIRDRMANDLIRGQSLKNKTKEEVEAVLGAPVVRGDHPRQSVWYYEPTRRGLYGFGTTYDFLVVFEGPSDAQRVIEYGFDD